MSHESIQFAIELAIGLGIAAWISLQIKAWDERRSSPRAIADKIRREMQKEKEQKKG